MDESGIFLKNVASFLKDLFGFYDILCDNFPIKCKFFEYLQMFVSGLCYTHNNILNSQSFSLTEALMFYFFSNFTRHVIVTQTMSVD